MTDLTLDQILNALAPKKAESLAKAIAKLAQYEADPVILKSELAELRTYGLNRGFEAVWTAFVKEPFFYCGDYQSFSEAEKKLDDSIGYSPEVHTAAGYLKKVVAATKADGKYRDAMLSVLQVLAPIAERANALKTKLGKRAPAVTRTSIERDERNAKAMTCQICARGILAELGAIAHHGYERPGDGYQTASCPGAKELPFEVSRERLGEHIVHQKDRLANSRAFLARVIAEDGDLAWTYEDRTACTKRWHQGVDKMVFVNRANWVEEFAAAKAVGSTSTATYDSVKAGTIARTEADIKSTADNITFQQARYDGWKGPTHRREGDAWVTLEAA